MSLEKLDLSVALKLAFVEDSLAKVEEYRTQLHQNAQKVKDEIHDVVEQQVGSLRMRERQLVRQVEVVTAHETCRLSTQQARLMHSRGALSATSSLLQRCVNTDSNTLSKIKVDEMFYSEEVQPAKHVSVNLDEGGLSSAISQFGSVQLPDTITHQPSPVIPVKVEEYDDEEHDVLHKSVASAASEPSNDSGNNSGPVHITVQFPRLSNNHNNDWLFRKHTNTNTNTAAASSKAQVAQNKQNDVAAWLGDLHLSTAVTGDDESSLFHCSEGFDMVGTPATSEGSSIEIVPHPQENSSFAGSGVCEIENVHHLTNDKSRWLSTKTPTEEANKAFEKLEISSYCQANEVCPNDNDCLCENECRKNALEKLQQSADFRAKTSRKRTYSEAEGIHSVLAHMAKILASENSQWLLKKNQENRESPRPVKCVVYRPPGDQWLYKGNNAPIRTFPRAHLPSQSNTWLLKNLKNQKNAQEKDEKETEKETLTNEKDDRITSEALSEALKRVSVDSVMRNEVCGVDEGYKKLLSLSSSTSKDQSWLLPRKVSSSQESYDKWQDRKDKDASKQLWLSSSDQLWLYSSSQGSSREGSTYVPRPRQESSPLKETFSWLLSDS